MPTEVAFKKIGRDLLIPLTPDDQEWLDKVQMMGVVKTKWVKERSSQNHKRFFALMKLAFDHWEPKPVQYQGRTVQPEKNFEEFRRWLIVLCGYYTVTGYPDGSVRIRAKSIAFGNMDEAEFRQLFSTAIDVLLKLVMTNYSRPDLERAVLEFAG